VLARAEMAVAPAGGGCEVWVRCVQCSGELVLGQVPLPGHGGVCT
jgi:hypothetical protein